MVRLATIGTNFITDWLMEGVLELPDIELTAVYSRTLEKGQAFAAKYGVSKVYDDYEKMAEDPEIDAVYVASPTCCHHRHSLTMLEHGKHVLCEKPVCSNRKELDELIQTAKEQGVIFMEAMKNVHSPGFLAIKENLHKIGPVRLANIHYCQYSSRYDNFKNGIIENAFKPELSNGALMDIGSYCIHFMGSLFGMPEQIRSHSILLNNGIDGAGSIIASYGDMLAEILYSKITDSRLFTEIQGERGCMIIQNCPVIQNITIRYRDGHSESLEFASRNNPMIYETENFIRLIGENNVEHPFLKGSQIEMSVCDEVRRQNGLIFPAD